MNGADAVAGTLTSSGVTACFANPGTSEMHLVAALDGTPSLRAVLCLFEGVATGAADGYGRMADVPAATLLHLGPGLANGLANLHNARRARTPLVNIVGDHATYHQRYDAPLETDIDSLARPVSGWFRRLARPADAGPDAVDAVAAARRAGGCVATLVLPADVAWGDGAYIAAPHPLRGASIVPGDAVDEAVATLLCGEPVAVLLGGSALRSPGLVAAEKLARTTGAKVLVETFPARLERGVGRPAFERLGYFPEAALAQLEGCQHLILAGARSPVAFFAYPGSPSELVPEGCVVHELASAGDDVVGALEAVSETIRKPPLPANAVRAHLQPPSGPLSAQVIGDAVAAVLPEGAILVDEAITAGLALTTATVGAAPHDLLALTGGAIGQGLPVATGAAVACPDRRVICVEADGSAMYTLQALWTQAREGLDVTTIVVTNRTYAILQVEMHRLRPDPPGPVAGSLFDLSRPPIDAAALARGFGVPAETATTGEELAAALTRCLAEPGPSLIEAVVPPR